MILAVDFDGTLVSDNWPEIGDFDMELVRAFIQARKQGHIVILHTCREGSHLLDAVEALSLLGLDFDTINSNPYRKGFENLVPARKVYADFYYDDKSFNWNRDEALAHLYSLIEQRPVNIFEALRQSVVNTVYRLKRNSS